MRISGVSRQPAHGARPSAAADAPWDKTLESWNPIGLFVLAALGAVTGVLVLLVRATSTPTSAAFVHSAGFPLWAAVVAAQSSVWFVLAGPLWREVSMIYRATAPSLWIWVVPGLIVASLGLLAAFSRASHVAWPLVDHTTRAWLLTGAAAASVGVPALFGITLVQDRVRRHPLDQIAPSDIGMAVAARAQMKRLLGAAGTVIGLAVLASGALRLATVPGFLDADQFPPTSVLLYGAFFTGLLLLVHVPAHLSLRRLCIDIREHYYPTDAMPVPTSADFSQWLDGRARIDGLTQVNVTLAQQLQASLFIFAPLVSGLLGALVPRLS